MGIDVELGPVRPAQVDHSGALLFEELIRAGSIASSRQCHGFGLTPEYSENARISRMAVEMRITRHHPATAGTVLCLQSRLADVADKYFRTEHRVRTSEGELVAILEFCLLIVDIDRRRSVRVPELVLDAWRDQERGATQGRDT